MGSALLDDRDGSFKQLMAAFAPDMRRAAERIAAPAEARPPPAANFSRASKVGAAA